MKKNKKGSLFIKHHVYAMSTFRQTKAILM